MHVINHDVVRIRVVRPRIKAHGAAGGRAREVRGQRDLTGGRHGGRAGCVEKDVQIHLVRSQYLGTRHVLLRKEREVKTPADMAGVKLRMPIGRSSA